MITHKYSIASKDHNPIHTDEEIAKKAISKKTGARGLRSILENLLLKTMFKLPTMENAKEVVIDQSVVKNKSEPLIIYSKSKKISAA